MLMMLMMMMLMMMTMMMLMMLMMMMTMMMMMPLPFFARFRPIPHSPRGARRDAPPRARRDARCCFVDVAGRSRCVSTGALRGRGGGGRAKSNHVVAGSLRRLPKDSWSRTVFCDKAND